MAAHYLIQNSTSNKAKREQLSLKYQVLAPETAFVGVVEGEDETIELIEYDENRAAVDVKAHTRDWDSFGSSFEQAEEVDEEIHWSD